MYLVHSQETDHRPISPFQRSAPGGHLTVYHNELGSPVLLAPARISDLKITIISNIDKDTIISWTAVGEHMDSGKGV